MRGVSGFHNSQRRAQQLPSGSLPIKESAEAPELYRGVHQGSSGGSSDGVTAEESRETFQETLQVIEQLYQEHGL